MHSENKLQYKVIDVRRDSDDVSTIFFLPEVTVPVAYKAGQYILVYFPETGASSGKAYTLSSAPHEKYFAITVKKMGVFSGKLFDLSVGDTFYGSLPIGYFMPDFDDSTLVLIAGGVGITPMRSIVHDVAVRHPERHVVLLHSVHDDVDTIFADEFQTLADSYNVRAHYFVTRSTTSSIESARMRRLHIAHDIHECLAHIERSRRDHAEYLICGSVGFVRDVWKSLTCVGQSTCELCDVTHGEHLINIPKDRIYTEAFFT